MSSSAFVVARGQQLAGFLLATVPLAERMLLYQVATTAWATHSVSGGCSLIFLQSGKRRMLNCCEAPFPIRDDRGSAARAARLSGSIFGLRGAVCPASGNGKLPCHVTWGHGCGEKLPNRWNLFGRSTSQPAAGNRRPHGHPRRPSFRRFPSKLRFSAVHARASK
jgi:hypothetical protein